VWEIQIAISGLRGSRNSFRGWLPPVDCKLILVMPRFLKAVRSVLGCIVSDPVVNFSKLKHNLAFQVENDYNLE
jgi:hypothetical protein